jgi:hypothetical protein
MPDKIRSAWKRAYDSGWVDRILSAFVVIQVAFIVYVNLFTMRDVLDNDMAKLFVNVAEMWRQKRIIIPGWIYDTTVEIDCSSVIAVLLYGITKNIFISFGIANIIFLFLYLFITDTLLKNVGFDGTAVKVAMLALMTPYSFGQLLYIDMLFFGGAYYCMKVAVPLLALTILLSEDATSKKTIFFSVLLVLFALITGFSSGPYVFISATLPVLGGYILHSDKTVRNNIIMALLGLSSLVGLGLNTLVPYDMNAPVFTMIANGAFPESVTSFVLCYIEMMGGLPDQSITIVSTEGVKYVLRMVWGLMLAGFAVACMIRAMRAYIYKRREKRDMLMLYVAALVFASVLILILTGLGNNTRYLMVSLCPLIIFFTAMFYERVVRGHGVFTVACFAAAFAMMIILSDAETLMGDPFPFSRADHIKYDELDRILSKYPDKDVVFLNDLGTTEILRARNIGSGREYVTLMHDSGDYPDGMLVFDYYSSVTEPGGINEDHILITNEYFADIDSLPEGTYDDYEMADEFQIYTVYVKK